ncbi:hypothetical protein MPSEU_000765800 [Mayamaea pseudoterrestris]|nr:hypothetical protein MPSEU_000765800 [Mayamaea pseudoterrestris]
MLYIRMMLYLLINTLTSWLGQLDAHTILVKLLTTTLVASAILTHLESRRSRKLLAQMEQDALDDSLSELDPLTNDTIHIRWMWENDVQGFLHNLREGCMAMESSNQHRLLRMTISLRPSLFLNLDKDAAEQVLSALREAPIQEVTFNDSLVQPGEFNQWMDLCECLGSLTTLKHVKFFVQFGDFRALAGAMQSFRQISFLSLFDNDDKVDRENFHRTCQAEHVAAIALALSSHPSLQTITCRLGKAAYDEMLPKILPVLPTMPLLRHVMISETTSAARSMTATVMSSAVNAAITSNDMGMLPPEICIRNLEFMDHDGASQHFCNGLAATTASRIHLDNVLVDPIALVAALKSSDMVYLKITNWPRKPATLPIFLSALAATISDMRMETLDLENVISTSFDCGYDSGSHLAFEQAIHELIQAASTNSSLRVLKLPSIRYTKEMDKAVAAVILNKMSAIQELTLCCPCMPSEAKATDDYSSLLDALHTSYTNDKHEGSSSSATEPSSCIVNSHSSPIVCPNKIECPLLLTALKSNFTVQHIQFKTCSFGDACRESFSAQSQHMAAVLTKLNQAGRKYLGSAPTDRQLALHVLDKVQDDANCLFVHLQENPLLMCQQIGNSL